MGKVAVATMAMHSAQQSMGAAIAGKVMSMATDFPTMWGPMLEVTFYASQVCNTAGMLYELQGLLQQRHILHSGVLGGLWQIKLASLVWISHAMEIRRVYYHLGRYPGDEQVSLDLPRA